MIYSLGGLCDPHSAWQRRTGKTSNGLIRQYLRKGSDLCLHGQAELDAIADSLNIRPRVSHNFDSALNALAHFMKLATLNNNTNIPAID